MIALRCSGVCEATCRLLNPLQEMPVMPTFPLHHCWAASHSITSQMSSCSRGEYSSSSTPSESPLPRRSRRTHTYPRSDTYPNRTASSIRHTSSLRYGMASSTTGNTSATPSITTSVGRGIHIFADSFFRRLNGFRRGRARPLHRVFASCSYLLHASFSAGATHMLLTFHSARSRSPTATRASLDEMWARISTLPLVSIIL